jgi:hypothetical protein
MTMQIDCIACGHGFALNAEYLDHQGIEKCPACRSLVRVSARGGAVLSVMPFVLAPTTTVIGGVSRLDADDREPRLLAA